MVEPRNAREDVAKNSAEGDPSSRVGSVIKGKWRIESLLGAGGMAAVYAASHRNGQRAALKILHVTLAHEESVRDRFLREGYVTNAVNHPACVAVLDDDTTEEGAPFLVMELLEGETLSRLWKRRGKKMPVVEALQIANPVLDCLAACHAAGVIHRDLKPPNIFVTHDGTVKVLDFGVAQLRDATAEKTRAGTALGTPHYMSPEQAMGLVDQLDGRADIFSVGAILHALVTGQRIHTARTENEALILAATTAVPSVARIAPDLPVEVISIIDKALAWDRRNRFDDARQMQGAVREAIARLSGVPIAAPVQVATAVAPEEVEQLEELPEAVEAPQDNAALLAEEVADEDDPRVQQARDLFKHFDRLFPTVRQLGWGHPATERALRTAHEAIGEALAANPDCLRLTIRPYSFLILGQTAWEPGPPFDTVPYNLFACGIRTLHLDAGITVDELRGVLRLFLVDPGKDLPPEDDIAAALWDLGLAHVGYETTDAFAEGDANAREGFFQEADELERAAAAASTAHINRVEARAMAVSTDRSALAADSLTSPLALDDVLRHTVATDLDLRNEQWSERYMDVVCDGLLDAASQGDVDIVLSSLRKSATDLVVAGRLDVAITLYEEIVARLVRSSAREAGKIVERFSDSMFGGDTLKLALAKLQAEPELLDRFRPVMGKLSADELHSVLDALHEQYGEPIREVLLSFVERALPGNEESIGAALSELDTFVVFPILHMLGRQRSQAARALLAELGNSKDVAIRIEAKVLAAGGADGLQNELAKLSTDGSLGVRIAALRAIARHNVKRILPNVVRQIQSAGFHSIEPEERRELLMTLLALAPDRGEAIALDLAKKGGLFSSESREVSRAAAIETLGAMSRSPKVAQSLREISQARWGTSEETRSAAGNAAAMIETRIAAKSPTSGGAP